MKKINFNNLLIYFVFFIIYLFPIYSTTELFNLDISKYIFFILTFIIYLACIIRSRKMKKKSLLIIFIIILLCFLKKSIEPIFLIEFLLLYEIIDDIDLETINLNKILFFSIIGVIIYSIIYISFSELRFVHTSIKEINQSALAIFLLGVIAHKKNKKIGNLMLMLGILTFSRNYLLCYIIFYLCNWLSKYKIYQKITKVCNFKFLSIIGITLLFILSFSFDNAYENHKLTNYKTGFERYYNIYDYSNYYRFITNVDLIQYYKENPKSLLTGVEENDFYSFTQKLAFRRNRRYKAIKPHNFFFSFLRIYGIFSLFIFYLLSKIMDKIVNYKNFGTFLSIFIFNMILGTGFSNYWLYLSVLTLMILGKEDKNERDLNYN